MFNILKQTYFCAFIAALLLFSCSDTRAQELRGIVKDKMTRAPLPGVSVTSALGAAITSASGRFRLGRVRTGDTLKISSRGYRPAMLVLGLARQDSVVIELVQNSIMLNQVELKTRSVYKEDSIRLREEFGKAFNYQLRIKDMLVDKVDQSRYRDPNRAASSTASLVGVNMLSVVKLLKNRSSSKKLKQRLLEQEEENFVDQRFTKMKIAALVPLKGDSLKDFCVLYRPRAADLNKMKAGDLNLYILDSYKKFLSTYRPGGLLRLPEGVKQAGH